MDDEVFVIGSGPAGLSCAAELTRRGVSATVLEKGARTAQAWAGRYDSLRFNTSRLHSALPGAPFPREWGQFPSRDQYVGYLTEYAEARHVRVHTGVDVLRLDPTREGWSLATNSDRLSSHHVVVATGLANRPVCPRWSQDSSFNGQVLHASAYRNPGPFAGEDVVVVGAGSTGMELAHELARGGAAQVSLSVRTPPNVLLRQTRGVPGDLLVPVLLRLPTAWTDRLLDVLQRRIPGDLTAYGLARPTEGAMTALMRRGAGTAVVDQEVIDAIRERRFVIVPAVRGLEPAGARLSDGRCVPADTVILATGFDTGLDRLVGHLDVLSDRGLPVDGAGGEVLPGLRFLGYAYRPGITGYVGRQSRRVARELAAPGRGARRVPAGSTHPALRTRTSRDRAASRG